MDNYETAKLLVTAYMDATPSEQIPSLFPDIDISNKTAVNKALRAHVINDLLNNEKYQTYFTNLSKKQIASLLAISTKDYDDALYSALAKLSTIEDL